jgi:hypothetical protein
MNSLCFLSLLDLPLLNNPFLQTFLVENIIEKY